jgi:plastocyanin
MLRTFTIVLGLMMVSLFSFGQLTITEISYNPPESGVDSLEYIEVYNNSGSPLNVKDYKFTKGITYTFPDSTIGTNKYYLIVKNRDAFKAVYNITANEWTEDPLSTTNTLTNGGEILEIVDKTDKVLISFKYEKVAPWPLPSDGTDGNGRSIELCQLNLNPAVGSSWRVSKMNLGFQHNAKDVFGSPGTINLHSDCAIEPDTIVKVASFSFTPANLTIPVNTVVRWEKINGTHNVNGTIATFPSNPEGFGNGPASSATWPYDFTFTKPGVYDYQCDPHSSQMKGKITVIDPNAVSYAVRSIVNVSSVNSEGVADSLGKKVEVTGVVYGVNLRPTGQQFTIIDNANNGIGVFVASGNLGYSVKEGDQVTVRGEVSQFNGFTQINAAELAKKSENNPLITAKVVTAFAENDESSLISISGLTFVDASQWTGTGAGFNVSMTNGTATYAIRIDNDVDAYTLPIPDPTKTYTVSGLLGQFDNSSPFTEGYQLFPRYIGDFKALSSVDDEETEVSISPNPVQEILTIQTQGKLEEVRLIDTQGKSQIVHRNGNLIQMSSYPEGLYILMIEVGGVRSMHKVIKVK